MLSDGRLPLNAAEHDAAETLAAKNKGKPVSLTRRDPGETGPLLVHVGDDTYVVGEDGRARKQRARS